MNADHPFFDSVVRPLFKRCVQCPDTSPSCPTCGSGKTCQLVTQSCSACASTKCVKIGTLPGQLASSHKRPIGAIVGGVVGGVVAVAIVLFLLYWFYFRPKRQTVPKWLPPEKRDQTNLHARDRQSARSIASTVLSRASNVIQIAYIPGVTVRSPPDSPNEMPPPMPTFPGASTLSSEQGSPAVEQHYFMPSDLRNSAWSDTSSVDPRVSVTPSLARTTLYGEGAIIAPVQQASRAHPNMVSVRNGGSTASPSISSSHTPPVPQIPKLGNGASSIVAKNVTARPIEIKKAGSGQRVPTLANLAKEAAKSKDNSPSVSEKNEAVLIDEIQVAAKASAATPILPPQTVAAEQPTVASVARSSVSTFLPSDSSQEGNSTGQGIGQTEALNAMIEEAVNRARDPRMSVRPNLHRADSGPFSDAHEVKDDS